MIMKKTSVQFARILITLTIIPFYELERIKKLWFQNEDTIQSWKYMRQCLSKHDPKTDKYLLLAQQYIFLHLYISIHCLYIDEISMYPQQRCFAIFDLVQKHCQQILVTIRREMYAPNMDYEKKL